MLIIIIIIIIIGQVFYEQVILETLGSVDFS